MYILTNEQLKCTGYLAYLPPKLQSAVSAAESDGLCEIRLRRSRPVVLYYIDGRYFLSANGGRCKSAQGAYIIGSRELLRACELVFEFSLYAHEDELREGFVTVRGGSRIGIAGNAKGGAICSYGDICSLNYRIAHEHIGIAEPIIGEVLKGRKIRNTVIISPPMCGKTSLLRDLVRLLSLHGARVGLCDSRGELAAVYDGEPCMDIGDADVLSGMPKSLAMMMLLRCMSPDVVACDELATAEDVSAAFRLFGSGVSLIATAHAANRQEFFSNPVMKPLASRTECVITLGGIGEIREVYHA
jgi:stage III sporulation protein AA